MLFAVSISKKDMLNSQIGFNTLKNGVRCRRKEKEMTFIRGKKGYQIDTIFFVTLMIKLV
jgi:hypothetical protein